VLPEAGEKIRVFWTVDRVWFRAVVTSRRGSVVHVDYLVRGWEPLDHDLSVTTWEHWEEGGPIDPGEAGYDGEEWLGEADWLAERAAQVAREATGGRDARAKRRTDARKRRQEEGEDEGGAKRVGRERTEGRGGESGGETRQVGRGKCRREPESTEQCVRRLVAARWEGEEVRLRDVWADAGKEGISVREVGRVVRLMEQANELMDRDGSLHKLT